MVRKKRFYLKDAQELIHRSNISVGDALPADWLFNIKEIMHSHIDYMWNVCPRCSYISSKSLITLAFIVGWQAGRDKMKLSQEQEIWEMSEEELIQLSANLGEFAASMELPMQCSDMQKLQHMEED